MKTFTTLLLALALILLLVPANYALALTDNPETSHAARIGTTIYGSLENAVSEAEEGDIIFICSDVTLDDPLTIDKNITLKSEEGQTYTLTNGFAEGDTPLLLVTGKLAAENLILNVEGIDGIYMETIDESIASCTLKNVEIQNASKTSVYVRNNAELIIEKGCSFSGDVQITANSAAKVTLNDSSKELKEVSGEYGSRQLSLAERQAPPPPPGPEETTGSGDSGESDPSTTGSGESDSDDSNSNTNSNSNSGTPTTSGGSHSYFYNDSSRIIVPAETFKEAAKNSDFPLIETNQFGQLQFDQKAAKAIADAAPFGTVTLIFEQIQNHPEQMKYKLNVHTATGFVEEFGEGRVTVSVRLGESLRQTVVKTTCAGRNGAAAYALPGGKKKADGRYAFTTDRCGEFTVEKDLFAVFQAFLRRAFRSGRLFSL